MSVQVRRGTNADRTAVAGVLASGEFYYCTDTKKVWVGDGTTSGGVEISDTSYQNQFNVLLYGAAGDGVTDDTTAIQDAIDAAEAAGGTLDFAGKDYLVTATLTCDNTDADKQVTFNAYGAKIFAASGHAAPVLEIGAASTNTLNVIVNGGHWGISTRDWTDTVGISLRSANRCVVRDVIVENCGIGIKLSGEDAQGCAYNKIEPMRIVDCLNPIYLTGDTDGWANSNKFFGGAIQYSSAVDAVDCSSGTCINIETPTNGDHIFNDNHFWGQTLEIASTHTAGKPTAVKVFGEYNSFNNLRIERFTAPYYYGIAGTIGAGSYYAQRNRIVQGYQNSHDYATAVKDDTNQERLAFDFFSGQETVLTGGSASYPVLGLRASSSGYKAIEVYDSAGTTAVFKVDSDGSVECVGLSSAGNIVTTGGSHVSTTNVYASQKVVFGSQTLQVLEYNGSPEGAATAPMGSICSDYTNGVLYYKASGSGNTGWVALATA